MSRRRRKNTTPVIHLSAGPLPEHKLQEFADLMLVFTDASRLRHGGLAAVIYPAADAEPETFTRTVALTGSNELELAAALFGLELTARHFPGRPFVLFSDNQDAIAWLTRAQAGESQQTNTQTGTPPELAAWLAPGRLQWIKGHSRCRGNALADEHARLAANS